MNRQEWEAQIHASNLCPTARLVALVVGSFGNWTSDRNVWPSTKAIADMCNMGRDTVQEYLDSFVEQGWLRVVKVRPGNVREYELCESVVEPFGNLVKTKRNLTKSQLQNLSTTGCGNETDQLWKRPVPVVESLYTNLKEPTNKEPKELQAAADATAQVKEVPLEIEAPLNTEVTFNADAGPEVDEACLTTPVDPPRKNRQTFDEMMEEVWN